MFIQVESDYVNVANVEFIEYVDVAECEVTFVSGTTVTLPMAAQDLMRQIERRLEVG
jgi:competence transcription factor ComK